jgi:hypothetical protein
LSKLIFDDRDLITGIILALADDIVPLDVTTVVEVLNNTVALVTGLGCIGDGLVLRILI